MKALRKSGILIIITMSLFLTSGTSQLSVAQQRLEVALGNLGAKNFRSEITAWTPKPIVRSEIPGGILTVPPFTPDGWSVAERKVVDGRRSFTVRSLQTGRSLHLISDYTQTRDAMIQSGGGAYLTASFTLPTYPVANYKTLGRRIFDLLGAETLTQEVLTSNLYSAAAKIPGWGKSVWAGQDEINLEVLIRPGSDATLTHVYLLAPDLIGDL